MLTPEKISKYVIEQYEKYNDGLINDVDFVGGVFCQCDLFLQQEQNKADDRANAIQNILDGV